MILAGGASARMGRDKALLPFRGEPLAARAAAALRPLTGSLVFAGAAGNAAALRAFALGRVAVDAAPFEGPLMGLRAALDLARAPVLVAACDAPWPSRDGARALLRRAGSGWLAAAGCPPGGEPAPLPLLCAASCLERIDRLLADGARSLRALLRHAPARILPLPPAAFAEDADTPEALERARR